MKFLTQGEKVRNIRKYLKMGQEDLQDESVSRGLVSMIEIGKRALTKDVATKFVIKFRERAKELNIDLDADENYFMRSPSEEAELYCLEKLQSSNIRYNIDEILEISCEFNLLNIKADYYSKKADFCLVDKNYDTGFNYYNEALAICQDIKQDKSIPYLYWKLGFCKQAMAQYEGALSYFNICERYSTMYKDTKIQEIMLYDKALCYKKLNKLELALENVNKYLIYHTLEDNSYFYAHILKANCYEAMENYDVAINIYNSLLKTSKTDSPVLGYIYNNLGVVYSDKSDFETALKHFQIAEKIRNSIDKQNLCYTLIEKSEVFIKQHLYDKAIKTIKLGLENAKVYNDYTCLLKGNYVLIRIYENINDGTSLKNTYLTIVDLLKENNNYIEIISIYAKLALIYLKENNIEEAKKYLIMLQN